MRFKYALFDLDGTLLESAPGILTCIRETLENNHIKYREEDLWKMIGPPFRVSMVKYCGMTPEQAEGFISEYRTRYEEYGWKMSKPYEGIEELIKNLKNAGVILATATSKPEKFTVRMLEYHGLLKYFDVVGAALNDKTRETKKDVVNWTLEQLGVQDINEAIMIGDRLYDIEGARECSLDTIAVLWGYGSKKEFEEYNAKYILETPKDVEILLLDS